MGVDNSFGLNSGSLVTYEFTFVFSVVNFSVRANSSIVVEVIFFTVESWGLGDLLDANSLTIFVDDFLVDAVEFWIVNSVI